VAAIYNGQRIVGVHVLPDGTVLHNNRLVRGVVEVSGVTFIDHERVLGVDVLNADAAIHNEQPVIGVVLIEDGRSLYNNRKVIPVLAMSGDLHV
jgi:hypothetical protein